MAEDQHQHLHQPSLSLSPPPLIPLHSNELTLNGSPNSLKLDTGNENFVLEFDRKGFILHKHSKHGVGIENLDASSDFSELTLANDAILDKPLKFDVGIGNIDGKGEFSGLKMEKNDAVLRKTSKLKVGSENLDQVCELSGWELEKMSVIFYKSAKFDVDNENNDTRSDFAGLEFQAKGIIIDKPSQLEVGIENLDGKSEISGSELDKMGVTCDKPTKLEVSTENLDVKSEISWLELEKRGVICDKPLKIEVGVENLDGESEISGLELEKKGATCDKPSKLEVGMKNLDGESEISGLELENKGVICDKPSKNEVGVKNLDGKGKFLVVGMKKVDVGDVDVSDSCNTFEVGVKKNENSKVSEVCFIKDCSNKSVKCSVKIQVLDETALIDVVGIDHKKNKRRGKKVNANSNGGKRKCVYTRKKLEALRFVKVKGQKKFWKEVYDGLTQTIKEEYNELGFFRHHKHGQRQQKGVSMSNFNGHVLVGMPAATK